MLTSSSWASHCSNSLSKFSSIITAAGMMLPSWTFFFFSFCVTAVHQRHVRGVAAPSGRSTKYRIYVTHHLQIQYNTIPITSLWNLMKWVDIIVQTWPGKADSLFFFVFVFFSRLDYCYTLKTKNSPFPQSLWQH